MLTSGNYNTKSLCCVSSFPAGINLDSMIGTAGDFTKYEFIKTAFKTFNQRI